MRLPSMERMPQAAQMTRNRPGDFVRTCVSEMMRSFLLLSFSHSVCLSVCLSVSVLAFFLSCIQNQTKINSVTILRINIIRINTVIQNITTINIIKSNIRMINIILQNVTIIIILTRAGGGGGGGGALNKSSLARIKSTRIEYQYNINIISI